MDECKPLPGGKYLSIYQKANASGAGEGEKKLTVCDVCRDLHSLTTELNLRTIGTHRSRQSST